MYKPQLNRGVNKLIKITNRHVMRAFCSLAKIKTITPDLDDMITDLDATNSKLWDLYFNEFHSPR